jgi:hypothetical protein
MQAEAERYGWRWLVAQVEKTGVVRLLDPKKAAVSQAVTLTERAVLEHPLAWFDQVPKRSR